MKVAVIGGREFKDYNRLKKILDLYPITFVVSGGANGADSLGAKYSREVLMKEPEVYDALWNDLTAEPCVIKKRKDGSEYNVLAGMNRNTDIINNCQMVVACWDGLSTGTKDSLDKAHNLKKTTLIVYF